MKNQEIFQRIKLKFKLLQSKRPLSKVLVQKLKEQFSIVLTYNSNAIEGNRLTLKETDLVINTGITVKGKPLRDHLEAKNHDEAVHYLYELVEFKKRQTISENLISSLHSLVVKNIQDENAGQYRKGNVVITG